MGKKRQVKKADESTDDAGTVVRGNDVRFELSDENSAGSARRKSKSKKKPNGTVPEAEVYDNETEYPSSRIIKRAPNGDVIVESLEETDRAKSTKEDPGISAKLDMHWETLSKEEKKRMLRIEKQEVFEVIKTYQSSNNCNCSVCGRRNVAMEQELEQIYNRLHDNAKETNSDTDFVLFHLNMIKELQRANASATSVATGEERLNADRSDSPSPQYLEDMRDEAVKYCLSSKAVESLKEEVLQFKHNKQRQQQLRRQQREAEIHPPFAEERDNVATIQDEHQVPSPLPQQPQNLQPMSQQDPEYYLNSFEGASMSNETPAQLREKEIELRQLMQQRQPLNPATLSSQRDLQGSDSQNVLLGQLVQRMPKVPSVDDQEPPTNEELKDRYMNFAKTFISSHPKIAHEYVNRMMMYPDLRALTEDLMYNNGQNFIKAMEDYVVQKGNDYREEQQPEEVQDPTQTPAERVPLTPEQYANVQRHIAAGMTASFESQARELQIAAERDGKSLFEQFLAGEDPISLLLKSLPKNNGVQGEQMMATREVQEEIDYDDEEEYDEEEYSDYEDEEESEYEEETYEENEIDEEEYLHHHHTQHPHHHEHQLDLGEEEISTAGNEDEYDSGIDEQERLEEGRRLIQIAITKLLQKKLVNSYHEKQAENNRLRLLQELEAEEVKKREKEEKKQRKREKEKEKKRAQQVAKEQEKKRKEDEEIRVKQEAEEREMQRREAQRQRVEETKRKKDEEKRRKLEDQRRKEEEQQRQKKAKEEQKRKREEEKRLKEEAKRQKEEELKAQKEVKRLEQERKKQLGDAASTAQELQKRRASETPSQRRLSTPPEAVPYGVPQSSANNDDLFHMINEAASKSLSTSSSHLQTLLQPQVSRTTMQQPPTTGISVNSMGLNPNWQTSEAFSNASYDSLASGAKSLDNTWGNMSGLFQTSPRKVQPHELDNQNAISSQQHIPQYPQFGEGIEDRKKSFNDELDSLTNFLSSTSLAGNQTSSAGFQIPEKLWSGVDQSSHSGVPYSSSLNTGTPVNNGVKTQRKSIWENDAPLGASPSMGSIAPNIWNGVNSSLPAVSTELRPDTIQQAYILSRGELNSDFVDVDKLYRTIATLVKDPNAVSYNSYLGQLVSMRSTHNCELLTNVNGSITHVRFPFSYSQQPQHPPPTQPNIFDAAPNVGTAQSSFNSTAYPNGLFDDLYNGNSSAMPASNPPVVPGVNASNYNYGQNFGQARTSNIWG
ncbi:LAFA_0F19944g1_1 [Lachancea sp. 'fantastica']|nr:LAFA_0F19944g1_1 [Lachancea sp. 'fantastica']